MSLALGAVTLQVSALAPGVTLLLREFGGLFIIYLGVQLMRRTKRDANEKTPTFFNGVILQFLNPKFPGVVIAVFANRQGQPPWVTAMVIVTVGAIGLVTYSTSGMLLSRSVVKDDGFRVVDRAAGSMLCLVGFWFMFQPLLEF